MSHTKHKKEKLNMDSKLLKNELGITIVRCPHLRTCRFGGLQSKEARVRCRGVLCRINHWEACLLIGYKCQWLGKRILVEVTGDAIRHLPWESHEHQDMLLRLKQLCCQECGHRVLDYYVVYGEAIIDVKCSSDGHVSSHSIK